MTIKIIDWQNCHSFYPCIHSTASKFWSTVNWCQSLAFDHSYLSWNDHCDQWLFQEIIFLLILFFLLEILLNDLEIVFLELKHINTFTKQKEQIYFFYLFIFYLLFHTHSVYECFPPICTFPLCENTGWVCSLLDCWFAVTLCNNALHILYMNRFIKMNPTSMLIFLIKLKFSWD